MHRFFAYTNLSRPALVERNYRRVLCTLKPAAGKVQFHRALTRHRYQDPRIPTTRIVWCFRTCETHRLIQPAPVFGAGWDPSFNRFKPRIRPTACRPGTAPNALATTCVIG